jgi:uncharacterized LabA/DUF88 family protein
MFALVDWDNVDDRHRQQGVRYVADRLWTALGDLLPNLATVQQFYVRLYGGWYGWNGPRNMTPLASQLLADLEAQFPFFLRIPSTNSKVKISAELAQSLLCAPKHVLPHTFRLRHGTRKITFSDPAETGCAVPHCPMQVVHRFFSLGRCPESGCTRAVDEFVIRSEQKLVDTMLVSDMVHLAHSGETCIAILSSDDDLWPGLLMAMSLGIRVVHLGTKRAPSYDLYAGPFRSLYTHGML